jgi:hypothetical protein
MLSLFWRFFGLLNTFSGETLSVGLTQADLVKLISSGQANDKTGATLDTIINLVNKGFLKSIYVQGLNAE